MPHMMLAANCPPVRKAWLMRVIRPLRGAGQASDIYTGTAMLKTSTKVKREREIRALHAFMMLPRKANTDSHNDAPQQ